MSGGFTIYELLVSSQSGGDIFNNHVDEQVRILIRPADFHLHCFQKHYEPFEKLHKGALIRLSVLNSVLNEVIFFMADLAPSKEI